jgi:hypothetical protein
MKGTTEVVRVKQASAWIEDRSAVHLKAVTAAGEPVALTAAEARKLANRLLALAETLEAMRDRG